MVVIVLSWIAIGVVVMLVMSGGRRAERGPATGGVVSGMVDPALDLPRAAVVSAARPAALPPSRGGYAGEVDELVERAYLDYDLYRVAGWLPGEHDYRADRPGGGR